MDTRPHPSVLDEVVQEHERAELADPFSVFFRKTFGQRADNSEFVRHRQIILIHENLPGFSVRYVIYPKKISHQSHVRKGKL